MSVFGFIATEFSIALRILNGAGVCVVILRYQYFSVLASIFRALTKTEHAL